MSANHLLDANIKDSECLKLAKYGLKFKHIGRDYWKHHFSDEHIISQLHQLNRATLVTRDVKDFYHRHLLHRNYCLLCLDIPEDAVATYTRRVYRHPRFNSVAQRCGKVIRVSSSRITYFELGLPDEQAVSLE